MKSQCLKTAFKNIFLPYLFPVVIVLTVLTVVALGFLLYRYLCHNKGDYRTTGELAPGEDPDEDYSNQAMSEKKEYFI